MAIPVDRNWWKSMFDEVYLLTDARSVGDQELTRREVDLVLALLPLRPGERILDLCGGHGRHSLELCARGFNGCTLVDYSASLVRRARESSHAMGYQVQCIRADARNTGLERESFDHVLILGNSLGYMLEPEADAEILAEAHRVLRPGGWVLVDITDGDSVRRVFRPNSWHEIGTDIVVCREREIDGSRIYAREVVLSKKAGLVRDRTYGIWLYSPGDLEKLLYEAGFRQVEIHTDFSPHRQEGDCGFMNHRMIGMGRKP